MRVLLAPDKFKGSLSAAKVCQAMADGISLYNPEIETTIFPLADGGEGTAEILTYHTEGRVVTCNTQDPLFRPIKAPYGISGDGQTAFIEMAQASGLQLLSSAEQNPMLTSSYGTGLMILDAIKKGVKKIVLAIGGSATNDAGLGIAAALGYTFLDQQGNELPPIGKSLSLLDRIHSEGLLFDPEDMTMEVACDVQNPLFGPNGAAFIYSPQKGANPKAVEQLDAGLQQFDKVVRRDLGVSMASVPGAGAAGGIGGGAIAFLNARIIPGISLVMQVTDFESALEGVDLVITGEGKIDQQTKEGKVVAGVARKAMEQKIPVAALAGVLELDRDELREIGIAHARDLVSISKDPEAAMEDAYLLAKELTRQMIVHLLE